MGSERGSAKLFSFASHAPGRSECGGSDSDHYSTAKRNRHGRRQSPAPGKADEAHEGHLPGTHRPPLISRSSETPRNFQLADLAVSLYLPSEVAETVNLGSPLAHRIGPQPLHDFPGTNHIGTQHRSSSRPVGTPCLSMNSRPVHRSATLFAPESCGGLVRPCTGASHPHTGGQSHR